MGSEIGLSPTHNLRNQSVLVSWLLVEDRGLEALWATQVPGTGLSHAPQRSTEEFNEKEELFWVSWFWFWVVFGFFSLTLFCLVLRQLALKCPACGREWCGWV